jgi:hypothetical protein
MVHCFRVVHDGKPQAMFAWIDAQAALQGEFDRIPLLYNDIVMLAKGKSNCISLGDIETMLSKHFPAIEGSNREFRALLIVCALENKPAINKYLDETISSVGIRWTLRRLWLCRTEVSNRIVLYMAFIVLGSIEQLAVFQKFWMALQDE